MLNFKDFNYIADMLACKKRNGFSTKIGRRPSHIYEGIGSEWPRHKLSRRLHFEGLDICADTPVGDKMIKRDLWWPKEAAQKFAEEFHLFSMGTNVCRELVTRFNRRNGNLSTSSNGVMKWELLKIGYSWLKLLMKQNSFIYIFKFIKLLLVASITMTVFFRTKMHHKTVDDGSLYLSSLYFSMVIIFFNGFTEVSMLVLLPLLGLYTSILGIEYSNFSL